MNDHKGGKNHSNTSETLYEEFDKPRGCSCPRARQFELIKTMQGCTTLPTRGEDHAAHPTDHVVQGGTHVNRSQQDSTVEGTPSLRGE